MYKIFWKYFLSFLLVINLLLIFAYFSFDNNLKIIGCDVGQGDSFLIIKGNTQILIDGGPPNGKAVSCLSKHLPFWDNTIEMVVITHPQLDHFGGLIEVFEKYSVRLLLKNSLKVSTKEYRVLEDNVDLNSTQLISSIAAKSITIGLLSFDIVWPERDYFYQNTTTNNEDNSAENRETDVDLNNFSIVLKLTYKNHKALFTGDIGSAVINEIILTNKLEPVEYIKVPHHGSKNGLTEELLKTVNPKIAVIGVGKNQWGHPHKEVLELLKKYNVKVFRTDELGDVVLEWE